MAKRKKFKRRKLPVRKNYLYIDTETYLQYLDDNVPEYREIEDIPDTVEELYWESKILPASFALNAENELTFAAIDAQEAGRQGTRESAAIQQKMDLQILADSIARWSMVDENDEPIPITVEALLEIEPIWIFQKIRARHQMFNTGKNLRGG